MAVWSGWRVGAAFASAALAVFLLALPILVVAGLIPAAAVMTGAAGLAAATGGGKLAAVAWGLGARFAGPSRSRTAAAGID